MISHEHKVIFVHIPKTGGQSVEQMFLDDLGLNWSERAPLLLRSNDDPAVGPERLAHLYADEYVSRGHISQADFDSYFKFAVVRDPYARIVSEYLYRYQKEPFWRTPSWEAFLDQRFENDFSDAARHLVPQTRYVMDSAGALLVDKIIPFERIGPEIEALSERMFGAPRSLPHRNKTKKTMTARKDKLRAKMAPRIYEAFRSDFEAFGYSR